MLIVGENLRDDDGDGLIDSPDDEGLAGIKESVHFEFDFSALGTVTVVDMTIIDTEEPGPIVQLFGPDDTLISFTTLSMTGNNGLAERESLGPTPGVARMVVALQGSGAIDNITFSQAPAIDIEKLTNGNQADGVNDPDIPSIDPGDPVSWEYIVTNTGDVPLFDVAVSDDQGVAVSCPKSTLQVGESMTCTASGVAQDLSGSPISGTCEGRPNEPLYENMGEVVGFSASGQRVDDVDPSHYCNELPTPCLLDLTKTCQVVAPPVGPDSCDFGDPVKLVFEYTGESCDATTNDQSGKAQCSGDPAGAEPIRVVMTKDANKFDVIPSTETILVGELVTIETKNGRAFPSDTKFDVRQGGSTLQSLTIHTSCSKVLRAGDQFGSMKLTQITTDEGDVLEIPPPPPPSDLCEITASDTLCTQRPTELNLLFNGGDCNQSSNTQGSDKWSCSGDAGSGPVRILAFNGSDVYLDQSGVAVGEVVDILASAVGRSDLDSEIDFEIYDDTGSLVQEVTFHTSCSQDLRIGDRFGSLEVFRFVNEEQGEVTGGTEVEYAYTVENIGTVDASNIFVDDVPHGPIGGTQLLGPGESITFTKTILITDGVTNVGTVTGASPGGQTCSASDTATVEVVVPPGSCADGKPVELTFEYTGDDCFATTNDQDGKFTCSGDPNFAEPIQVVITKDVDDISVDPTTETINVGDTFRVFKNNGDKLKGETRFDLRQGGQTLQSLTIHTSCSEQLVVGDQFGGVKVVGFVPE